jgi:ferritin
MLKKDKIIPTKILVFGNELSIKVQEEINNAISINIESIYNRLLANIQFSIALFSTTLVIFAIVFGVIYFSKIRDAENLIKEIQKTPELFFKQFYREQYNKNVSNLFSQDYIKRNDAINKLTFNPEIDINDYDLLQEVLFNELSYDLHVYFNQNISTLTSILMKIDNSKTISFLMKILKEQKYDTLKHNNILTHVIANNSTETVTYIKDQLLDNNEMGTYLVSLLANCGRLNDYIGFILEKCNSSTLQMLLNMSYPNMWHINTDNFFFHISSRDDIDNQSLHAIISSKSFVYKEKIALVLHFYSKNTQKFDMPLNNLVSTISSDENAKNEFLLIAEKDEYKELVKKYFIKNDHQKSYFANFQDNDIVKQNSNETNKKNPSVVIKEHGLYLSEDGVAVVNQNGLKYAIKQYSRSVFGPIFPVMSGVMIEGTFIDIEEIKKDYET